MGCGEGFDAPPLFFFVFDFFAKNAPILRHCYQANGHLVTTTVLFFCRNIKRKKKTVSRGSARRFGRFGHGPPSHILSPFPFSFDAEGIMGIEQGAECVHLHTTQPGGIWLVSYPDGHLATV